MAPRHTNEVDAFGDEAQRRIFRKALERLGKDEVRARLALRQPIGDRPQENPPPVFAIIWLNEQVGARKRRRWMLALIGVAFAVAGFLAAMAITPLLS